MKKVNNFFFSIILDKIFNSRKMFQNENGVKEVFRLSKIINSKKITSVTIECLSKNQKPKEITIRDNKLGIILKYKPIFKRASIRFSSSFDFEKITGFNCRTLEKRNLGSPTFPYEITFHIDNLTNIGWKN